MALRTVGVRLAAEVSGYVNNLRTAKSATKDFAGELDKAAKAGKLDAVADSAARAGLVLAGGFALAVNAAAKFDKQMSAVSAATHASAGDMEQLRQAALQAGKDTSFSATQAAQGIEELSKAGVSTAAILGGGLKGALDLAAAGSLEVGEAAEIAASAMTQFKLDGGKVPHVADLLAAGAGKAQGSVHDLGQALNQAGLVSAQMGLSVEDTTGTLAAFASAGMVGSDAGTSLKTALLMLAKPTGEAAKLMEDLGISAYDSSGQFVGITSLAGQLQTKLGGLTQEQRNAALATIFGADAIRSASILYEQGAQGIQGWIDKTNDAGFAAETAREKTDNLAGDIERLTGSLETLAIESSTGATSGLRTLVQGMDNLVGSLSGIPAPAQNAALMVVGVSGAALLAAAGAAKLRAATARAGEQLSTMGPLGERASRNLDRVSKAAGRVGVAFAAMQIATALGGDSLNGQVDALAVGLDRFVKSGDVAGEAARLFGDDMGMLDMALKDVADTGAWSSFARGTAGMIEGITGLGNVVDSSLQHSRERLEALDGALAQMVQKGNGQQAAAIFDEIAKRAAEQGVSVDELKKILPGYAGALEVAATASGGAAGKIGEVATAADDAKTKVEDLKDAFDKLFGIEMDLDRATLDYKNGIVDLNKELTEGKRTLDTDTQAGRDNVDAVLDQVDRIKELRDARIEHGETLDVANGKYVKDIAGLRATMLQAGYTKGEIDALLGKYKEVPDEAETEVSAPGAVKATGQVTNFAEASNKVPPSKTTTLKTNKQQAERDLAEFNSRANHAARDRTVVFTVEQSGSLGAIGQRRWGGIDHHMAAGGMINAHFASAPTVLFGERATGGEAFIPRNGDMARSRAVAETVVRDWLGGRVLWQRPMTQTAAAPASSSAPSLTPAQSAAAIRAALIGLSVQLDGRTVGYIQGRQADIYARGG